MIWGCLETWNPRNPIEIPCWGYPPIETNPCLHFGDDCPTCFGHEFHKLCSGTISTCFLGRLRIFWDKFHVHGKGSIDKENMGVMQMTEEEIAKVGTTGPIDGCGKRGCRVWMANSMKPRVLRKQQVVETIL